MQTNLIVGVVVALVLIGAVAYFTSGGNETSTTTETASPTETQTQTQTQTTTTSSTEQQITETTISETSTTQTTTTETASPTETQTQTQTQTTTQETITTTETTQTTTTSTQSSEIITVNKMTFTGLLKNFKHMKIEVEFHNATTGETSISYFVYNETPSEVDGQQAVKVEITLGDEETGESSSGAVWMDPDFNKVLQIEMEGQVFTGPQAEMIGQQMLFSIDSMLFIASDFSIQLVITGATAEMEEEGWELTDFHSTTVTISGITYDGYYFKAKNVNDAESDVTEGEAIIAKLLPDQYYMVYMKVNLEDGSTFKLQITEAIPAE